LFGLTLVNKRPAPRLTTWGITLFKMVFYGESIAENSSTIYCFGDKITKNYLCKKPKFKKNKKYFKELEINLDYLI